MMYFLIHIKIFKCLTTTFMTFRRPLPFAILRDDAHQGDGLESAMRVRLNTHSNALSKTVLCYCYNETYRDLYDNHHS